MQKEELLLLTARENNWLLLSPTTSCFCSGCRSQQPLATSPVFSREKKIEARGKQFPSRKRNRRKHTEPPILSLLQNMDQIVAVSSSLLSSTIGTAAWTLKPLLSIIEKGTGGGGGQSSQQLVLKETVISLPPNMRKWIAAAGLMGASAVAIGAYGVSIRTGLSNP